jgi:peptidoglycan/xylan/chitin deacetylase (PgdA/CDA1 family)/3D (Asp-Asp-Asp) domain-containing protein
MKILPCLSISGLIALSVLSATSCSKDKANQAEKTTTNQTEGKDQKPSEAPIPLTEAPVPLTEAPLPQTEVLKEQANKAIPFEFREDAQGYDGRSLQDKQIVLTFDDGPSEFTGELGKYLSDESVEATFFVVGSRTVDISFVRNPKALMGALKEQRHLIANHSFSHRSLTAIPEAEALSEIAQTHESIKPFIWGNNFLFRTPYGDWNSTTAKSLNNSSSKGYVGPIHFDIGARIETSADGKLLSAGDWDCWAKNLTVDQCLEGYITDIERQRKGIVILHDIHRQSIDLTMKLVPELKKRGYSFVRLDQVPDIADELKKLGANPGEGSKNQIIAEKPQPDFFGFTKPETLPTAFKDVSSTWYNVHKTASDNTGEYPLLDISNTSLGITLSKEDFCKGAVVGTIRIPRASGQTETLSVISREGTPVVDCSFLGSWAVDAGKARFALSQFQFGSGAKSPLVPFRTIAVDPEVIPLGSVIFISEAVGASFTGEDGQAKIHDGFFFAADSGAKGNDIRFFIGTATNSPFAFSNWGSRQIVNAYSIDDPNLKQKMARLHNWK